MDQPLPQADLERLARRRAGAKMGWYIHAAVFVCVNLSFAAMAALFPGHRWMFVPTLAWGFGLAIHGLAVFLRTSSLHDKLVQRERERLQRDPW